MLAGLARRAPECPFAPVVFPRVSVGHTPFLDSRFRGAGPAPPIGP